MKRESKNFKRAPIKWMYPTMKIWMLRSSKNTKVCTLIFFVLVLIAEKIAGFLYVVRTMQEVTVYKYKNFIL